jgi:hypothetical protein
MIGLKPLANKQKVVNEILELIRYNGVGDELGEGYQEGYCDAVDDIVTMIEDYYEQTSA